MLQIQVGMTGVWPSCPCPGCWPDLLGWCQPGLFTTLQEFHPPAAQSWAGSQQSCWAQHSPGGSRSWLCSGIHPLLSPHSRGHSCPSSLPKLPALTSHFPQADERIKALCCPWFICFLGDNSTYLAFPKGELSWGSLWLVLCRMILLLLCRHWVGRGFILKSFNYFITVFVGHVSFHIHFFQLSFPRAPSYLPLEAARVKTKKLRKKIKPQSSVPGLLTRERPLPPFKPLLRGIYPNLACTTALRKASEVN